MPYAFARGPQGPAGEGGMTGIPGAAADGVTDDTQALTDALARSNTVIDGGCLRYKYGVIDMTGVENAEIRNVIFNRGTQLNLWGCRNITFRNCRWEGVFNNGENRACYGVALRRDAAGDGSEPGCENIAFYGCTFRNIAYNDLFTGTGYAHHTTGQAILPMSVHNLTVKDCFFTQIRGNAAIHFNSAGKLGFVDISDNLFYLTAFGGVSLYAYDSVYPTVNGRLHGNRFIGCGLGYLPPEYLAAIPEKQRGVGCAALLGGAGRAHAPYRQHLTCESNVFIDCCESAIEGPAWNPCIGNYCKGQGTLQSEENCRLMEEKYKLDYALSVRYTPSVNFIYRNVSLNADDSSIYEAHDPIVFSGNVMGGSYVDRNGFIHMTGGYSVPVSITGNVMEVADSGKLYTHFLNCRFDKGLRLEQNQGIRPYFNSCSLAGDVIIDDMLSTWNTDFSACHLTAPGDRFPQVQMTNYDPACALLENDQAAVVDGVVTLTARDAVPEVQPPTDYAYSIEEAEGYEAGTGYIFPGPDNPTHIDTGIELLKDGGDFTIFLRYFGDDTDGGTSGSGYNPLFMMWDAGAAKGGLIFGGRYANRYTSAMLVSNTTSLNLDEGKGYMRMNTSGMKAVMRRTGSRIEFWLCRAGDDAATMTDHLALTVDVPESGFDGQTGTLLIGARDGYYGDNSRALSGRMEAFQVFTRALTDEETGLLLYGRSLVEEDAADPSDSVIYDLADDEHYDEAAGCVTFDGTFGIDTGVELFADSSDFTVTAQFELDNYHDAGLPNFSFIPVLSAMNYTEDRSFSPGFDVGLSLQQGENPEAIPRGGFVTLRNSWKYTNGKYVDGGRYFGYSSVRYGVILIRENGVLSVYDANMKRLATISGTDAASVFSGTLHIGENMTAPTLAGDNRLKGRVYACRVYDRALTPEEIEALYPNIYSSEFRTKGAARFLVPNRRYSTQSVACVRLDMLVDMGEYGTAAYAGRYPRAVGVKPDGVDEVIWLGTGSDGHIQATFKHMTTLLPWRSYGVEVVNTGLAPGLTAKIRGFRCVLLGKETAYTDAVDALDFDVEWDRDVMILPEGGVLSGCVRYAPENANTGTELTVTCDTDGVSASATDGVITVTGLTPGEAMVTVSIPCGTTKTYRVLVEAAD